VLTQHLCSLVNTCSRESLQHIIYTCQPRLVEGLHQAGRHVSCACGRQVSAAFLYQQLLQTPALVGTIVPATCCRVAQLLYPWQLCCASPPLFMCVFIVPAAAGAGGRIAHIEIATLKGVPAPRGFSAVGRIAGDSGGSLGSESEDSDDGDDGGGSPRP
jgi:hypothetical protein